MGAKGPVKREENNRERVTETRQELAVHALDAAQTLAGILRSAEFEPATGDPDSDDYPLRQVPVCLSARTRLGFFVQLSSDSRQATPTRSRGCG